MIYLLLGPQTQVKEKTIADLKAQHLPSKEALSFDYEVLHGAGLDAKDLKKSLIALPSIAKKRIILLRQAEKLKIKEKKLILELFDDLQKHLILILESDGGFAPESFIKKFGKSVTVVGSSKKDEASIFDFTRAITQNKKTESLKMLSRLLEEGNHPLQLMGGILWAWKRNRPRITGNKFQEGLVAMHAGADQVGQRADSQRFRAVKQADAVFKG